MGNDVFNSRDILKTRSGAFDIYRLDRLETNAHVQLDRLPFSIRIMLEAVLRKVGSKGVTPQDVLDLAAWQPQTETRQTMPFFPGRVIMQDFTGVPVVVDLASMRDAMQRLGGDPARINPIIPVDVVIDHSVQVDFFASPDALRKNAEFEFKRNNERYQLLHWAQKS
ncbi:MAG TPA: aconitase family protein, partial [Anaerolineaceae bacterium]|nr:aconitase family protein [Anaerolineaceae bacterium]